MLTEHDVKSELSKLRVLERNLDGIESPQRAETLRVVIGTLDWVLQTPGFDAWSNVVPQVDQRTKVMEQLLGLAIR